MRFREIKHNELLQLLKYGVLININESFYIKNNKFIEHNGVFIQIEMGIYFNEKDLEKVLILIKASQIIEIKIIKLKEQEILNKLFNENNDNNIIISDFEKKIHKYFKKYEK
jgi:hypothetical protein